MKIVVTVRFTANGPTVEVTVVPPQTAKLSNSTPRLRLEPWTGNNPKDRRFPPQIQG